MNADKVIKTIKARDWPMDEKQCAEAFKRATGRKPSQPEIKAMAPDVRPEAVKMYIMPMPIIWSLAL